MPAVAAAVWRSGWLARRGGGNGDGNDVACSAWRKYDLQGGSNGSDVTMLSPILCGGGNVISLSARQWRGNVSAQWPSVTSHGGADHLALS